MPLCSLSALQGDHWPRPTMRSIFEGRPRLGLIAAYLFTSLSFVAYLVAFSPLQSLAEPRALLGYLAASSTHHKGEWQKYKPQQRVRADCPDYDPYSRVPHGPYSDGPLSKVKSAPWTVSGVPFMRPSEGCRTFNSSAVEVCLIFWYRNRERKD